jgi:hypothetical protein
MAGERARERKPTLLEREIEDELGWFFSWHG